jgi:RNase P/RNase MRP subunit POP5
MVRVKRRYFTLQIRSESKVSFSERDLIRSLKDTVQSIHGDFGLGSLLKSLAVKRLSLDTRTAVLVCQRGPHTLLSSSIPFVRAVKQVNCTFQVIHLSGTIRSSFKFLVKKFGKDNKELESQLSGDLSKHKGKTKVKQESSPSKKKRKLESVEEDKKE